MKKTLFLLLIIITHYGCKKEVTPDFSVKIIPENRLGVETYAFKEGDSLFFKFTLSNQSGKDAKYDQPCLQYVPYLKVYKQVSYGVYEYIGQPYIVCPAILIIKPIKNDSTVLLRTFPWSEELGCPELKAGKYYVGDTFTMDINNKSYDFNKRIYFDIY